MNTYDLIPHLERFRSYDQAVREFHPQLPDVFNIADAICRSHADAVSKIALFESKPSYDSIYTFGALGYLSDKFANALRSCRIEQGHPVAVMLPQSAALVVASLGILKLGGIVVPIATDAPESIIEYTLKEISPCAIVISEQALDRLANLVINISSLKDIFVCSDFRSREDFGAHRSFWREVYGASPDFTTVETEASAPAFIFPPASTKDLSCVVHAHRLLIGQLPAFEMSNNFDLSDDTVFFTPSEWSSIETLFGLLYPALIYGRPVLALPDVMQNTMNALERREITNLILSADDLYKLRVDNQQRPSKLRNIIAFNCTGQRIDDIWGLTPSRVYAIREAGVIAATCHPWFASPADSQGRAAPGSQIEITGSSNLFMPAGSRGKIAVDKSSDSMFLGYLNRTENSVSATSGEWFVTDDLAMKDEDGNLLIR